MSPLGARFLPATRRSSGRCFARAASTSKIPFDPAVYLVTDDKYAPGIEGPEGQQRLAERIVAACRGGASMVQLRLKHASTQTYVDAALAVKGALARADGGKKVAFLIDDRVDVALAVDADGCHVGNGDMDPALARKLLGPEKILGVSTYGERARIDRALSPAVGADYVAGGGITASTTKAFVPKGISHMHALKYELLKGSAAPLVAIGGVGQANAWDITYAGADGLASVSALLDPADLLGVEAAAAEMARTQKAALAARRLAKDAAKEDQGAMLAEVVNKIRVDGGPLVHCITNYVSMDIMANILLAAGMSPAMVHAELEAPEFAGISSAVSINVGTLSPPWTNAFFKAAEVCKEKGTPWVLDPVGVGAISYRTGVVKDLLQMSPTVLRGNPSEILACGKLLGVEAADSAMAGQEGAQRGADSSLDSTAIDPALIDTIARKMGGTVVVTGSADYCTDGTNRYLALHSAPGLQKITAAGCSLGSLIGGFVALHGGSNAALASAQACAFYTLATQQAEKAGDGARGPGSLRVGLMDQLSTLDLETIRAMTRIERV